MYRYYLTQRPPAPGTFPNGASSLESYDYRQLVVEIGRPAWGWVEFETPLTDKQIFDYELTLRKEANAMTEELFEIMVENWKQDNPEGLDDLIFGEVEEDDDLGFVIYAEDSKMVYSLTVDQTGKNIRFDYMGTK